MFEHVENVAVSCEVVNGYLYVGKATFTINGNEIVEIYGDIQVDNMEAEASAWRAVQTFDREQTD